MENLTDYIHIRVSKFEKNRLKWLADKYANGNLSLWIIYASLNIDRSMIDNKALNESKRNRGRKKTSP
jgi:hypothetical protein